MAKDRVQSFEALIKVIFEDIEYRKNSNRRALIGASRRLSLHSKNSSYLGAQAFVSARFGIKLK